MPSDLQVSNIKDLTGSNTGLSIASDGQATIAQNNPTVTLGSNATFPAGTVVGYEKNQTVISSAQSSSGTYTDITGSSLTYTPTTGASFIVYECSFVESSVTGQQPLYSFRFFLDGVQTKAQDCYAPYYSGSNSQFSTTRKVHRMIYSASGWTTDKVVKMQFRSYSSSSNYGQLHHQYYNHQSIASNMGSAGNFFTDVDVTIYSVM